MQRTQILVTTPQAKALKRISKDTGLAVGEIVRRAIDAYLVLDPALVALGTKKKGSKRR